VYVNVWIHTFPVRDAVPPELGDGQTKASKPSCGEYARFVLVSGILGFRKILSKWIVFGASARTRLGSGTMRQQSSLCPYLLNVHNTIFAECVDQVVGLTHNHITCNPRA
jgi:hypothetical protein